MRIILHTLPLLLVVQCVTVMNINYSQHSKLRDRSKTAHDAKIEQFKTAKISANALKKGNRTHSLLRQRSSQPMLPF